MKRKNFREKLHSGRRNDLVRSPGISILQYAVKAGKELHECTNLSNLLRDAPDLCELFPGSDSEKYGIDARDTSAHPARYQILLAFNLAENYLVYLTSDKEDDIGKQRTDYPEEIFSDSSSAAGSISRGPRDRY